MMIDIVFVALLALAAFKGYQRGLIVSVCSVLGLVVGLVAAMKLSAVTAAYLKNSINTSAQWMPVIAFLVVFFIFLLLVRLAASFLEKTVKVAMLGWLNRLGGIVLFILLYTTIFSVILFYAGKINLITREAITASNTYSFIQPWGPWTINTIGDIIPIFKDMFKELEAFFQNISNKIPAPKSSY
jgi:membrane protein required for colicin V production